MLGKINCLGSNPLDEAIELSSSIGFLKESFSLLNLLPIAANKDPNFPRAME